MEINEIQQALVEFHPLVHEAEETAEPNPEVRKHMLLFLQKVLGYDLEEDIVRKKLTAVPERPKEAKFDPKIKFVMTTLPSHIFLDEKQEELAIEYALSAATNVVMLSNGVQVGFYSIDMWEGNWEVDTLLELDLRENNSEDIAQSLWPLAKKDCHRKIIVAI